MTPTTNPSGNPTASATIELCLKDSSGTHVYSGHPTDIPAHIKAKFAALGCPIGTSQAAKANDRKIEIVIEDANGAAIMKYKGLESAMPDEIVAKLIELGHPVDSHGRIVFDAPPHPPHPPTMPEFGFMAPPQAPMPPHMPELVFKFGGGPDSKAPKAPKAPKSPKSPGMAPFMPAQPPTAPQAPMPPQVHIPGFGRHHMVPPQPPMHPHVPEGSHGPSVIFKRDGSGGNVKVVIQSA